VKKTRFRCFAFRAEQSWSFSDFLSIECARKKGKKRKRQEKIKREKENKEKENAFQPRLKFFEK